jgi:hypothetical protein
MGGSDEGEGGDTGNDGHRDRVVCDVFMSLCEDYTDFCVKTIYCCVKTIQSFVDLCLVVRRLYVLLYKSVV